jgi:carboxylesterase
MDTQFLLNADLDGNSFTYEGNNIGILLIHGFTATTTEVRLLADNLSKQGYTIHAPLLPGHGTTPDELNKTTYQNWIETVEEAYSFLHQKCPMIFIAGESMGALLSLHLAAKYREISGIICYSPAIQANRSQSTDLLF